MAATTAARLARIAGRRTYYEVVVTDGATRLLVGYTPRRSRDGLRDLLLAEVDGVRRIALVAEHTATDATAWVFAPAAGQGLTCARWAIHFSGRTQREAYIEGELPSIYAIPA